MELSLSSRLSRGQRRRGKGQRDNEKTVIPAKISLTCSLNSRVPFVTLVFPVSSPAATDTGERLDQFDPQHVLGMFVAKLPFKAETERGSMWNIQGGPTLFIGQDRLRMAAISYRHTLVVRQPTSTS